MDNFLLDSYAMLCYSGDKVGVDEVHELLSRGQENTCSLFLNVFNLVKIYYSIRRRYDAERASEVLTIIEDFHIHLEGINKFLAIVAAKLKAEYAIAKANYFCAATALNYSATVFTGDPEFEKLEG